MRSILVARSKSSLLDPRYDTHPSSTVPRTASAGHSYSPAAQNREPSSQNIKGDPTRFVIKCGHTTLTTVGRLNGFESRAASFDTVHAAPYDSDSGWFFARGDFGVAIVGANEGFVALLAGGTGPTDYSDITYCGTPAHRVARER